MKNPRLSGDSLGNVRITVPSNCQTSELGLTPDMYDDVVKGTFLLTGGYHTLTPAEVHEILVESE